MSDFHNDPDSHIIPTTSHNPNAFAQFRAQIPLYRKVFGSLVLDIAEHVEKVLQSQGKTHRDLARLLGKTDSEVSKWLSGTHNLTLESVAKLSAALKVDLLISPAFPEGYFGETKGQSIVAPVVSNKALEQLTGNLPVGGSQYGLDDVYHKYTSVASKENSYATAA